MEKVKIYIVEDEMIIAESMSDILEDLGYEVLGISVTAKHGLEQILKLKPDFALLDIRLKGEENGIWLGKKIQESIKIPFIFLTSFGDKETILEATDTSPYGYLLKPIEKQSLYASIEVALKKFLDQKLESPKPVINEEAPLTNNEYIYVKDEYQFKKFYISEILFVKASGNYIEIYTPDKRHVIKDSLKSFKEDLPANHFFQTHRSYLVNLSKVVSFGNQSLIIGNQEIPIAKALKNELKQILKIDLLKTD